ncbi:MAG: ABC transporter ATP-binding protein [Thermomicrobiales bacterium]
MDETAAGTDIAISIRNLHVARGGTTILRDINLQVPRGVLYGLVGPSGSGKTTLVRAIIGRQQIAEGSITVDSYPAGSSTLRRRIGYLPQLAAVYDDLTGRENLEFFASVYRARPGRVNELLDLLELQPVADRPVLTYSGGQQRRVGLGIALLAEPQFLLLDEPTVGLDPRLRQQLWEAFARWAREGATLIITTHVMDEAARVDRLAFLSDGKVTAEGSPKELLERTGTDDLEDAAIQLTVGTNAT